MFTHLHTYAYANVNISANIYTRICLIACRSTNHLLGCSEQRSAPTPPDLCTLPPTRNACAKIGALGFNKKAPAGARTPERRRKAANSRVLQYVATFLIPTAIRLEYSPINLNRRIVRSLVYNPSRNPTAVRPTEGMPCSARGLGGWQAGLVFSWLLASSWCSCPHSPVRTWGDGRQTNVIAETCPGRAGRGHALRLRGGKAGRRTQPAKVPSHLWTKRYQADWDKLKMRNNRVHHPETGISGGENVKIPGSYWAFGQQMPERAPNMTVGYDIPYEDAHLKSDALLFHPGAMMY